MDTKRLLWLPAMVVLSALLLACSDDEDEDLGERADVTPTAQADGLQFVFDSVGGNINIDELKPHLSEELRAMPDEDITEAVVCFPPDVEAEVLDQAVQEDGESATLTVHWEVTAAGAAQEEETVERTWEFERVTDGENPGYQVTALPQECPFEPADSEQDSQDDADLLEDGDEEDGDEDQDGSQ